MINAKILKSKRWHGKHQYASLFYGVKVQLLITKDDIPVEFGFVPGSEHDAQALRKLPLELPAENKVYADSAYTNYEIEGLLFSFTISKIV